MIRSSKIPTKQAKQITTVPEISKSQAQIFLSKVPEGNTFWCNDGRLLRDMKDLKEALSTMSDHTFAYHSNDIRKDFANWVRDIIGDYDLARDLDTVTNREQAARIVADRYIYLTSTIS
jgi:hypothetical protein